MRSQGVTEQGLAQSEHSRKTNHLRVREAAAGDAGRNKVGKPAFWVVTLGKSLLSLGLSFFL